MQKFCNSVKNALENNVINSNIDIDEDWKQIRIAVDNAATKLLRKRNKKQNLV